MLPAPLPSMRTAASVLRPEHDLLDVRPNDYNLSTCWEGLRSRTTTDHRTRPFPAYSTQTESRTTSRKKLRSTSTTKGSVVGIGMTAVRFRLLGEKRRTHSLKVNRAFLYQISPAPAFVLLFGMFLKHHFRDHITLRDAASDWHAFGDKQFGLTRVKPCFLSFVVKLLESHFCTPRDSQPCKTFNSRLRGIFPFFFHSAKLTGAISTMASKPFLSAALRHSASCSAIFSRPI